MFELAKGFTVSIFSCITVLSDTKVVIKAQLNFNITRKWKQTICLQDFTSDGFEVGGMVQVYLKMQRKNMVHGLLHALFYHSKKSQKLC